AALQYHGDFITTVLVARYGTAGADVQQGCLPLLVTQLQGGIAEAFADATPAQVFRVAPAQLVDGSWQPRIDLCCLCRSRGRAGRCSCRTFRRFERTLAGQALKEAI